MAPELTRPELPAVTRVARAAVESGAVPGVLVQVRHGLEEVHCSAFGTVDADGGGALRPETVFWLASLSKPIGATAILMLAEDRALGLQDPLAAHLPEFAVPGRVRVLTADSPSSGLGPPFGPAPDPPPRYTEVPAERPLTIVDLPTHTGGLQSIFRSNPEFQPAGSGDDLATHTARLGSLVRDFQPGRAWAYSNAASFDVLSRIVEVASGKPLAQYLDDRVFGPLGLRSTGFGRVADPHAQRLVAQLAADPMVVGQRYTSTAAGLWSNAADYLTFVGLLTTGRAPTGAQLVSSAGVEAMTSNQIGDLGAGLIGRQPTAGIGFGAGSVAVIDDPQAAGEALPQGTFGWDGVGTRRFWSAPSAGWSMFLHAPPPRRPARDRGRRHQRLHLSFRTDRQSAIGRCQPHPTADRRSEMKLATVRIGQTTRAVRIEDDHAVDLDHEDLDTLLQRPDWAILAATAEGTRYAVDDLDYAPLVTQPSKIICVGLNYRAHILEVGLPLPEYPTLFAKFAPALIGAYDDIELSAAADAWDWEAELALVIGAPCRNADDATAAQAIAGYTVANDISARDWQMRTSEWLQGKTFAATTPLGPHLVSGENADPAAGITCSINSEQMQSANTGDLVFGPAALVAYISTITPLQPGDVILTGTPGGVGFAQQPPRSLVDGDLVTTGIEGIGECRNACRRV